MDASTISHPGRVLVVRNDGEAYVAIAAGHGSQVGYVYVLRNDGSVFVCDRATSGWSKYGQGTPTIPASTAYVDIAAGPDGLEGYVYVLRADGKVYVTDSAVRGWSLYGQGNPSLPSGAPDYRAIAAGDGTNRGSVFIMRGSGDVYIATSAVTGWSRYSRDPRSSIIGGLRRHGRQHNFPSGSGSCGEERWRGLRGRFRGRGMVEVRPGDPGSPFDRGILRDRARFF
jgi:hypothetical protein